MKSGAGVSDAPSSFSKIFVKNTDGGNSYVMTAKKAFKGIRDLGAADATATEM